MDPGVRGRALRTLSGVVRTEPDRVRAVEACLEGLGDAHPYVRASALAGLGHLGEVAAIERMLPLLEDPASAVTRCIELAVPFIHDGASPGALALTGR